MIERRFHKDLYALKAVQGAIDAFARFAQIELSDEGDYQVVRVSAKRPERERKVAQELGNFALGLSRKEGLA